MQYILHRANKPMVIILHECNCIWENSTFQRTETAVIKSPRQKHIKGQKTIFSFPTHCTNSVEEPGSEDKECLLKLTLTQSPITKSNHWRKRP